MTKLEELAEFGQAIWLDYIRRSFIATGELQALVDKGLRGVTFNPTIFEKVLAGSADYDEDLRSLFEQGKSDPEIYEELAVEDIRATADMLRPMYKSTGGLDGYVSLEVSPQLAYDTDGTIAEAKRLFSMLGRPNVMIKVPATRAGMPAIEALISEGINVNVTLIFSVSHYNPAAEAYITGLERRLAAGGDISFIASVASFFVSQVDTAVDLAVEEIGDVEFQGGIAIANAKAAYARFKEIFSGERWERLVDGGAHVQRLMWGSTSTKDPRYADTLYVNELIGYNTVNTLLPATLKAFLDHGKVADTLDQDLDETQAHLYHLPEIGVNIDVITDQLQTDGVEALAKSFKNLMESIAKKREELMAGWKYAAFNLGRYQDKVNQALEELRDQQVISRIWAHDHTVWKPEPGEISNRLGWLHSPEVMGENVGRITAFVEGVRESGYTNALLLGMGGSSLAPEVFRKTFGVKEGYLDLSVCDSTDPGTILTYAEAVDPQRTLFIVSTKSGTTVETLSLFKFFYNWLRYSVGENLAGEHFIAITDPETPLVDLAKRYNFRKVFRNDPNIGGRYSALSYFGLIPAALIGVDIGTLLDSAMTMVCNSEACNCAVGGDNQGGRLGVVLGDLATVGRDKATVISSFQIETFCDWAEQLIAESTGKEGMGILPVVREKVGPPASYGEDRLFVYMHLKGDDVHERAVAELEHAGYPVVRLSLSNLYDLGGHFFLWEMAVAIAGHRLGINPFDQPDVEAAKSLARQVTAEYKERGSLPSEAPTLSDDGIAVYDDIAAGTAPEALMKFLDTAQSGAYISIQAYLHPAREVTDALQTFRMSLRNRFRLATTLGFGPRFLHSTGQLHKGDAGKGLFIQFTTDISHDAEIPDEAGSPESLMTFGVLKAAQAIGDRQALIDRGRKVIRFHFARDPVKGIKVLTEGLT
ncbi:MAG: bifunctional transaldolase/phosoglucose isomerase [Thermodesulfobacteriota bacterium]